MTEEDIVFKSYHDINLTDKNAGFMDCNENELLNEYIIKMLDYSIGESSKSQKYALKRESNEIFTIIKEVLSNLNDNDVTNNSTQDIADILLDSELNSIRGAAKPIEGGLVQSVISKDGGFYYAIMKNEIVNAITRDSIEEVEAFLYDKNKKSPIKLCVFEIKVNENDCDDLYEIINIFVDDSIQRNHAVYWYESFLSLRKLNTDEVNTSNAVEALVNFWERNLEDKHKSQLIRNDTISFISANDNFDFDDYMDNIEKRHDFSQEEKDSLFPKLKELPNSRRTKFDKRFTVAPNSIKKSLITKTFYPVSSSKKVSLSIEGEIDFNSIYVSEENSIHFIKIKTTDKATISALTKK